MKNIIMSSTIFFLITGVAFASAVNSVKPPKVKLADLYKKKEVRFLPDLVINEQSLPDSQYLLHPISLVEDNEGNIYVSDYLANNLKKFDAHGKWIKSIGRKGAGPGDLNGPSYLAFAGGNLIVWDGRNWRLCIFSTDGNFIRSVKLSQGEFPQKIRTLPTGDVLIEFEKTSFEPDKPQQCIIKIFSKMLEFKETVYNRPFLSYKLVKKATVINVLQPFPALVHWEVSPTDSNKIIIGFSERYVIEIHDRAKGKISTFQNKYEPIEVTKKDKENFFNELVFYVEGKRTNVSSGIKKLTSFPKFKPAFRLILADSEGNILVFPEKRWDQRENYFDAFDSSGKFIQQVKILSDINPMRLTPGKCGTFWSIDKNEDDEPIITRFKITQ